MMAALHGASRSTRKELLTVSGGGHNDTWKKGAAMEGISRFVEEVTRD